MTQIMWGDFDIRSSANNIEAPLNGAGGQAILAAAGTTSEEQTLGKALRTDGQPISNSLPGKGIGGDDEVVPASPLFLAGPTPTPTLTPTLTETPTMTATDTHTPTQTASTPSGEVWKYYYYAGAQRVAVRACPARLRSAGGLSGAGVGGVMGSSNPEENGLFYTLGNHP